MALNIVGQIDPEGGDKSIVNEKYDSKSRTNGLTQVFDKNFKSYLMRELVHGKQLEANFVSTLFI